MEKTVRRLAVLYADVSGSTRIYEKFGDTVARENINKCLELLTNVATDRGGRLVKTIGDEIMCEFPNPENAAIAAREMHQALLEASEENRFSVGPIHVKIGWHYGEVSYRGKDVIGEAPDTAQQVIKLAKPDEILTSGQSLSSISEELKQDARLIDKIEAVAYKGDLSVYSVPWEDDAEITRIGASSSAYEESAIHKSLVLEYSGKKTCIDHEHTHCHIGRDENNDLCVEGKFTSRHHAEIIFVHGSFHLRDISTNGTAIIYPDGHSRRLHREEAILSGKGIVCFGGLPENDPGSAVRFECKRDD